MSKHTIILEVELDDSGTDKEGTLMAIAEGAVRNAKEDYQTEAVDEAGIPTRYDGYQGPFINEIEGFVVNDDHEVKVVKRG
jgi:hypothetical protein